MSVIIHMKQHRLSPIIEWSPPASSAVPRNSGDLHALDPPKTFSYREKKIIRAMTVTQLLLGARIYIFFRLTQLLNYCSSSLQLLIIC